MKRNTSLSDIIKTIEDLVNNTIGLDPVCIKAQEIEDFLEKHTYLLKESNQTIISHTQAIGAMLTKLRLVNPEDIDILHCYTKDLIAEYAKIISYKQEYEKLLNELIKLLVED